MGPGQKAAAAQVAAIAALGGVGISADGDLPPDALTTLTPLAGVIWWGDAATARALESALSARDGKIIALITGQPDRVSHRGTTWEVTQADGAGNNVWEPGVFGWTKV
jgi:RHH-type proline utilization regulon transcriptional repressor/proline dehydrogenase/delta 1-pyrroline-5-carboxylate dehydrogenase